MDSAGGWRAARQCESRSRTSSCCPVILSSRSLCPAEDRLVQKQAVQQKGHKIPDLDPSDC